MSTTESSSLVSPSAVAASGRSPSSYTAPGDVPPCDFDCSVTHVIVNPLSGERQACQYLLTALRARFGTSMITVLSERSFSTDGRAMLIRRLRDALIAARVRRQRRNVMHSRRTQDTNHTGGAFLSTGNISAPINSTDVISPPSGCADIGSSRLDHSGAVPTASCRSFRTFELAHDETLLVAGGDGTIAFIAEVLEEIMQEGTAATASEVRTLEGKSSTTPSSAIGGGGGGAAEKLRLPAVGLIPIGTGNDLARSLGYMDGFTQYSGCCLCCCCPTSIDNSISTACGGDVVECDRWEVSVVALASRDGSRNTGPREGTQLCKRRRFINYCSLGLDAAILSAFHDARVDATERLRSDESERGTAQSDAKLQKGSFSSRCRNKVEYGWLSTRTCFFGVPDRRHSSFQKDDSTPRPSTGRLVSSSNEKRPEVELDLTVDGQRVRLPPAVTKDKSIVFGNVATYAAGATIWPIQPKKGSSQRAPSSQSTFLASSSNRQPFRQTVSTSAFQCVMPPGVPPAVQTSSASEEWQQRSTTLGPVSLTDGQLEVQGLGGFWHMGILQLGVSSSDPIAQGSGVSLDVWGPPGQRVVFSMQVDGEPLGDFPTPFRVEIHHAGSVYLRRCADNASSR